MLKWHAHESTRTGGKLREPLLGENFSGSDVVADSLLREAVQNSLDARLDPSRPVRVRIYLSGDSGALTPQEIRPWFTNAWPHFAQDVSTSRVASTEPCRFVVVEDFNTKGLQGDVTAGQPIVGVTNPWFLFFRVEGQSRKTEDERGRWGVGKVVFPLSSRARSFFAATVRADDAKRFVMGQAMLKSRRVGDKQFDPDLWFCIPEESGFELPSEDTADFDRLASCFHLSRTNEPGLSVVVPYAEDDITRDALVLASLREYFYPILTRALIIEIHLHGDTVVSLDSGSIRTLAGHLPDDVRVEVLSRIEMAAWLIEHSESLESTTPPDDGGAIRWRDELIPSDVAEKLRSELDAGQVAGLRVPTRVVDRDGTATPTQFAVVLKRSDDSSLRRAAYVRSDLVIPEVKGRQVRGFYALVVATDLPLVTMLGDAENPAHTDWHVRTSNFKDKYKYATSQLDFVKHCPNNICHTITVADGLRHKDAIGDYFWVPEPDAPQPKAGSSKSKGSEPDPPPAPTPQPIPRPFAVTKVKGGFVVAPTITPFEPGRGFAVEVAYDVRSGDPLRKYDVADFRLSQLQRSLPGLVVKRIEANSMVVAPTSGDFRLEVKGFDEHRDLFVKVREVEVGE